MLPRRKGSRDWHGGWEQVRLRTPRVLVLRLSSLGDVVLTSSFLNSLMRTLPEAVIDYVVRDDLAPLAAALPGVQRVIAVPRGARGSLLRLARQLAANGYDHVFDLHHSLRSRILTIGLRRQLRGGFSKQSVPRWFLIRMHRDVYERFGGARSMRERLLGPLRQVGAARVADTGIVLSEAHQQEAAERLQPLGERPLLGIAVGARWATKRWPAARFAAAIRELVEPGRAVVLVGAATEAALSQEAARGAPAHCLDLTGKLDLLQTAAVLQRCRCVLSNDSGLAHLAEAVGRPVVTLFGPTSPRFGYAPYRDASRVLYRPPACSPCSKNGSRPCHRSTHECMENIGVKEVVAAVSSILQAM